MPAASDSRGSAEPHENLISRASADCSQPPDAEQPHSERCAVPSGGAAAGAENHSSLGTTFGRSGSLS